MFRVLILMAANPPPGASSPVPVSNEDKFYQLMNLLVMTMQEKESATSQVKWERKTPVIKAENPRSFMAAMVDLERLFSELGYNAYKKRWPACRNLP